MTSLGSKVPMLYGVRKNRHAIWAPGPSFANVENVLEEIGAKSDRVQYVGFIQRPRLATGSLRRHTMEQENLVDEALTLPPEAAGP